MLLSENNGSTLNFTSTVFGQGLYPKKFDVSNQTCSGDGWEEEINSWDIIMIPNVENIKKIWNAYVLHISPQELCYHHTDQNFIVNLATNGTRIMASIDMYSRCEDRKTLIICLISWGLKSFTLFLAVKRHTYFICLFTFN